MSPSNVKRLNKKLRKRGIRITMKELKIPESVEKTSDNRLRENIIAQTSDRMLDALNQMIDKNDLTFEEALHASDIAHLSIIAKYIDFRIDMRLEELAKLQTKESRMYA